VLTFSFPPADFRPAAMKKVSSSHILILYAFARSSLDPVSLPATRISRDLVIELFGIPPNFLILKQKQQKEK